MPELPSGPFTKVNRQIIRASGPYRAESGGRVMTARSRKPHVYYEDPYGRKRRMDVDVSKTVCTCAWGRGDKGQVKGSINPACPLHGQGARR